MCCWCVEPPQSMLVSETTEHAGVLLVCGATTEHAGEWSVALCWRRDGSLW